MKVSDLIILGPQGSGKGTQAKLLEEKFGFAFIGIGDSLREKASEDSELGRRVKSRIDQGLMADASDIAGIVREKVKAVPKEKPLIVEGFPRSLEQYELMKALWPGFSRGGFRVIFIELSDEEAVERLSGRLVCENCARVYVKGTKSPCPKCGGRLISRRDDYPEAVRKRLDWFKSEVLPVIRQMEKDGQKVIRVDGSPTIEEVHREILQRLELK